MRHCKEEDMRRSEQKTEDTWDLESLYESHEDWQKDYDELSALVPRLEAFRVSFAQADDKIYETLCAVEDFARRLEKNETYAFLKLESDGLDAENQRCAALASSLGARFQEAVSWLDPALMGTDEEKLRLWLSQERFAPYRVYVNKVLRMKEHTLSAAEERIMALNSEAASAVSDAFNDLNDIDLDFGQINGDRLTHAGYSFFMHSSDEQVRRQAYSQLYEEYYQHRHVLSRLYAGSINQDIFEAKARGYSSCLDAALFEDNIPSSVYSNLIDTVHENFDVLHRYYRLRAELLRKDRLNHWDVYVPMVSDQKVNIPYTEAVDLISRAVSALGDEYTAVLRRGLTQDRWVDRYENEGKRSGAFSAGSFSGKPFILTSYRQDLLDSVFTLIHEGGHSMHSYYSAKNNPFLSYNYTIFEAEVASTFNEELLSRYMIRNAEDENMKAFLIAKRLDDIVATFFRQTMFAEFELLAHQEVEKGGAATLDWLLKCYRNLLDQYFGPSVSLDDRSALECLRIPHFYRAFYVWKYATGLSAAFTLADRVLCGGERERNDYLAFLSSGGSQYPLDSLAKAGADLRKKESIEAAVKAFSRLLDQLEAITRG